MSSRVMYQDKHVVLYQGNAFEMLPTSKLATIALTDPPYFAQTHKGARKNTKSGPAVLCDFPPFTPEEYLKAFELIGRSVSSWVVSFVDYHAIPLLEERLDPENLRFVRFGVWIKEGAAPQFSGDRPGTGWEALAFLHKPGRMMWNGGGKHGVFRNRIDRTPNHHPTQKPMPLIEEMIRLFTSEGDIILDPFAGSGITLRVARRMGRRAIGIELSPAWAERAAANLADTASEGV